MIYEEILPNPQEFAEKAEKIYRDDLQESLEKSNKGEYVAIDPSTGKHYLGKYAEIAVMNAQKENPNRLIHLIRIGGPISLGFRYTMAQ
ncbi:MAG: hypothetical protein OXD43_08530 [Bacteroidetes bacterium]|nr:hypothetical protein [Bacteroidota bacterium]